MAEFAEMGRKCLCIEMPTTEYKDAWDLQTRLVAARKDRLIETDIILFLEHSPVFTLGRRGGEENLTVPREFLTRSGIPMLQVERGGNITYHGPGQLVVYPIMDLKEARLGVVDFVSKLEDVMILTAADWDVKAERNPVNRGVWVGNHKLGSIGVAVRRGITFHGFAFNVNLSLEPFNWINPCGLQGIGITSLERELTQKVELAEVRESARRHMQEVFGLEFRQIDVSSLKVEPEPDDE